MSNELAVVIAMDVWPQGLARINDLAQGAPVVVLPALEDPAALPVERVNDCTVVFTEYLPTNLYDMPHLEWVQMASAGYEHLRGIPLQSRGIRVTNASGVHDAPIAEWCLAMMLVFERDIRGLLRNQAQRTWDQSSRFQSELRGRRVGVLGYGNIGREVARVCRCLGLEVWAMARHAIGARPDRYALPGTGDPQGVIPHRTFTTDQMADFLPHLDYLILTMPRTLNTEGIIGERELRLLAPTAVLLNPSRGPLVQEKALVRALRENWFAGAALDTHYQYPLPPDHPLWSLPNAILTPHISGANGAREFLPRVWDLFAQNLARYLEHRPLLNELRPEELASVGAC